MAEKSSWRSRLKKKLRPEQNQVSDEEIRRVQASIDARAAQHAAEAAFQNRMAEQRTAEQREIEQRDERERREMQRRQEEQEQALIAESQAQAERDALAYRQKQERAQNASAANIAQLRDLMRKRYQLDVSIWDQRTITRRQKANRHIVEKKCKRADDLMDEMRGIVERWEEDLFREPGEWRIASEIKQLVLSNNKHAVWSQTPPWECDDDGNTIARRPVPRAVADMAVELDSY